MSGSVRKFCFCRIGGGSGGMKSFSSIYWAKPSIRKKRYVSVNFSKAKHGTGFICSAILREIGCVKSGAAIIRRLKGKAFPVCKLILPNLKLKVFGVFSISFREENGAIVRG